MLGDFISWAHLLHAAFNYEVGREVQSERELQVGVVAGF